MSSGGSVGEVLAAFRRANGIPEDEAKRETWTCRLGPVSIRLPNFRWRRSAILAHDLHHLLTGYPCTMRGECQVAAWEFGAGKMPHWAARLFCLPLVLLGLVWSPRRIWNAFTSGRRAHSLHGTDVYQHLAVPLAELRAAVDEPKRPAASPLSIGLVFLALVIEAGLIVSTPVAAIVALCFAIGIEPLS